MIEKSEVNRLSNIISDISKRVLIVKGIEEVRRIKLCNKERDIIKTKNLYDDIWEVELIKRVGDYFRK
ncbi:hypothetical protein [Clostridium sp. Marseille-Q2269]|uniref:hypothetical protein n=1 Tax=Clostridium sp. Marseille-Q2269 TaxID=2942205 RepID=UPI002072C180|nr:hypothetical protein [Clostridium sp. Marseille-Q2269]